MNRDVWLRVSILALGGLLFILLFLADKTNLNNESTATIGTPSRVESEPSAAQLPPLAPDPQLDTWLAQVPTIDPDQRIVLLDSVIELLTVRRRLGYAADYAAQQAELKPDLARQLRAGILSQQATELDYIRSDTNLLRRYQQQARSLLEASIEADPSNEAALLSLGLILIQDAAPMQGILTIRKVLDINPDNLEASYRLGQFSLQTGQFEKAQQRFEKVLSLTPENQAARYGLAVALSQLGQPQAARPLLEIVVNQATDLDLKQSARDLLGQL
jgi:tetratricopeptide (TPR) repeat protein